MQLTMYGRSQYLTAVSKNNLQSSLARGLSNLSRLLLILVSLLTFTACGGGGGGNGPANNLCASGFMSLELNSGVTNQEIQNDETQCFMFSGVAGQHYRLNLSISVGSVDIAAHDNPNLDSDSVIVYSLDYVMEDEITFTATETKLYYIELYGYSFSRYSFTLNQVSDADAHLALDRDSIDISAFSAENLSENQRIIQSSALNYSITHQHNTYSALTSPFSGDPVVTYPANGVVEEWLSVEVYNSTYDGIYYPMMIDISISDITPVGSYSSAIRLNYESQYTNKIKVFKDITINYTVLERTLSIPQLSVASIYRGDVVNTNLNAISALTSQIAYSTVNSPNGFVIDDTGNISWTAELPFFTNPMNIHWAIQASDGTTTIETSGVFSVLDANYTAPIVRSGLYLTRAITADVDSDGVMEMLTADSHDTLSLRKYNGTSYEEIWVNPRMLSYQRGIGAIATADLNNDGFHEYIIALSQTRHGYDYDPENLIIIDGQSKEVIASTGFSGEAAQSVLASDIDNDGVIEIVVKFYSSVPWTKGITVYDSATLVEEWSYVFSDSSSRSAMFVGNFDNDATLEIALSEGLILDGERGDVQWRKGSAFGYYMTVGDLDGDGVLEIIGSNVGTNSFFSIYDTVSQSVIFTVNNDSFSSHYEEVFAVNYDDDPEDELLVKVVTGGIRTDSLTLYDFDSVTNQLVEKWTITSPFGYATLDYTTVGNFDAENNTTELVISNLYSYAVLGTTNFNLSPVIAQQGTGVFMSGLSGAEHANIGSNQDKLLFTIPETFSSYAPLAEDRGPRVVSLDPDTWRLDISSSIHSEYSGCDIYDQVYFNLIDYDFDGAKELISPPCRHSDIIHFDVESDSRILTYPRSGDPDLRDTVASNQADFNGDGTDDVLFLTRSGFVYVYDAVSQQILHKTPATGNHGIYKIDVKSIQLDEDPELEIVTADIDGLIILDLNTVTNQYEEINRLADIYLVDIEVGDMDGDGLEEIITASKAYTGDPIYQNGHATIPRIPPSIRVFNRDLTLNSEFKINRDLGSGTRGYIYIAGVTIENLSYFPKNLVLSFYTYNGNGLKNGFVTGVDHVTGGMVWESPFLISDPQKDSLKYTDFDGDGANELFFATSKAAYIVH